MQRAQQETYEEKGLSVTIDKCLGSEAVSLHKSSPAASLPHIEENLTVHSTEVQS